MITLDFKNPVTQLGIAIVVVIAAIGVMFTKVQGIEESLAAGIQPGTVSDNIFGEDIDDTAQGATLELSESDNIYGNPDAEIIIFEFSDYECPFCQRHHPTLEAIVNSYDGQVAWVYKHYPLSTHPNAQEKAEAAECVAELGGNEAFWDFSDRLFASGTQTPVSQLADIAADAGVDNNSFQECVASERHAATVQADFNQGISAGVQGTPGNIIVNIRTGEQRVASGALPQAQLESVIDDLL